MELKNLGFRFLLFLVSWTLLAPCRTDAGSMPRRLMAEDPSLDLVVGPAATNIPTITEAIATAVQTRTDDKRFVIKIKPGVYHENIIIDERLPNLMLLGDGKERTIITGELSVGGNNLSTFDTAPVGFENHVPVFSAVEADGFIARGITFRNTAGLDGNQAAALRVSGDKAAFYSCSFEGYQDTLYVHSGRQFYKKCDVYGTVDFIFGNAMAVFQDCHIYVRTPKGKQAVITASKREGPDEQTGIVIQKSHVAAAPGENLEGVKVYLGRPWGHYARTVVMESKIDSLIDPEGWLWWAGKDEIFKDKIYYAEYENTGPGSSMVDRVDWSSARQVITPQEAEQFSVENFIDGNSWLPDTNVPFSSDL
ncbi:pectinesterase 2-like [Ipomoea triloba]|uniref:pectinesterase 2-like n=1 Tax=Ipomoea triloba TaxID=35885 RepID=UPI00125D9A56|nr:pectinesterase 2-like [Ipomoea triloba]